MSERPLHVRVAEALGWHSIEVGNAMRMDDHRVGYPPKWAIVGHKQEVPRYDTDWSATGPLIERVRIEIDPDEHFSWVARFDKQQNGSYTYGEFGDTPLIAVCNLILALKRNGKL